MLIDKQIEAILNECEGTDKQEDAVMGEDKSIYEVPDELTGKREIWRHNPESDLISPLQTRSYHSETEEPFYPLYLLLL
jgi:hypothetical protein